MIRLGTFGTRITRRMVGLFVACAVVPVAAALFASYQRVYEVLVYQRVQLLRDVAAGYGSALVDRLNAADAVAHSGGIEASGYFRAGVVIEPGGGRTVLFGDTSRMPGRRELADLDRRLASGQSGLAVVKQNDGTMAMWLVRERDARRVALELDPKYLWAVEDRPYLTDLCVVDADAKPMACTQPLPDGALATLRGRAGAQPHGDLPWTAADGTRYLSGFNEIFLRGRFGAGTWTIVASQPEWQALAPVKAVGQVVVPVLLLALLGAALVGVVLVRRTLSPLQPLTDAARRVGTGDFSARVAETGADEFGALASAFNTMSARLGRQFNSQLAHAEIDAVILSGVDLPRVVAIVLQRMAELAPAYRHFLVLADRPEAGGYTLHSMKGATVLDLSEPELRRLLEAPSGGVGLPGIGEGRVSVLPIGIEGRVVGAIVLTCEEARAPTQEEMPLLRDLADRVAVALVAARRERELQQRANYDSLTHLANRALGLEDLTRAVAAAERTKRQLAVLFVDLDGFSDVNDSAGHAVGDQVLVQVAARLRRCLRKSDILARIGGDEFAVVLPEVNDAVDAAKAARNVIEALAPPFQAGARVFVSAGIGIALYPGDGASAEELLRHADLAMYHAKSIGRSQVAFFEPSMNTEVRRRMETERELRVGIDENQFVLHYQPQLDLRQGRIVSAEALMRWMHPKRGLVPPAQFIGFAESSGMIDEMGRWALRAAVAQFATWRATGVELDYVSVNVSPRQFRNPTFTDMVASALREYMLPASALHLEITESALMDQDGARANLAGLTALGVPLELDDFGTGYSSLAHLQRLPIGTIKIDRGFIRDIEVERSSQAVVRAAIDMAEALGKSVVAEGVEHAGQLALLHTMGCYVMQGYLLSPPVTAAKFVEVLRSYAEEGLQAS